MQHYQLGFTMKCFVAAFLAASSLVAGPAAMAQLDFWNKPQIKAPSRKVSMNRCLKKLEKRVEEMMQNPDSILQSNEFWIVEYRNAYCEARQRRFKDLGMTVGVIVFLEIDRKNPGDIELRKIDTVYGDVFPWGS